MAADWTSARRAWEKWTGKHVGSSGMPIKAALLLNYDPTGPSRLFPMVAEQEGAKFTAVDLQPSIDFFRRNNLQTEFFSIGPNQWWVKPDETGEFTATSGPKKQVSLLTSKCGLLEKLRKRQTSQKPINPVFQNLQIAFFNPVANNLEGLLKSMKGFSKGTPLCLFHPPAGCVESEPGTVQTD
ncbi:hypothetical protein TRIUR3_22912 [Triticum urartu]|uniref:Uncharacterized protein n=1 Tax=Triticum urartu TaxID=4572 RepID=M7ZN13_TRIUA|nr:hypothetical protein TRIUR3_22912 [Triticum urartu]